MARVGSIPCPAPVAGDLRSIAYHEAGHVVAGTRLGLEVVSTDLQPDAEGGNAHTHFSGPGSWFRPVAGRLSQRERELVERVVTTFMAGFAAELRSGNRDPTGSGWDADLATREWLAYLEPDPARRPALAQEFFERAQRELERPGAWAAVEAVAAALVEARQLDGDRVREIVAAV